MIMIMFMHTYTTQAHTCICQWIIMNMHILEYSRWSWQLWHKIIDAQRCLVSDWKCVFFSGRFGFPHFWATLIWILGFSLHLLVKNLAQYYYIWFPIWLWVKTLYLSWISWEWIVLLWKCTYKSWEVYWPIDVYETHAMVNHLSLQLMKTVVDHHLLR